MSSSDLRSRLARPPIPEPTTRVERLIAALFERLFAAILALLDQVQTAAQTTSPIADPVHDEAAATASARRLAGSAGHPRARRLRVDLRRDVAEHSHGVSAALGAVIRGTARALVSGSSSGQAALRLAAITVARPPVLSPQLE